MVKNFKKLNVVQVGTRLTPFKSVMYNELELTEKFGININNVNMAVVSDKFNKALNSRDDELEKDLAELKELYDVSGLSDETLKKC